MKNETFKFAGLLGFKGNVKELRIAATVVVLMGLSFYTQAQQVVVGAAQPARYLPLLLGKQVGVIANHTSMVDTVHLVDYLLQKGINVKKTFAPEHGFRGTASAGEHVKSNTDSRTGLPIISLYGNKKKPSAADLEGIDILVFDIQDVGVRFYTYISTMTYCMEAAAENGLQFLVLDRPNPNGHYTDGPLLDMAHSSFVGLHPVPVVHGLTVAEYARMVNGELWLKNQVTVNLQWVTCLNYNHQTPYMLPIAPSPNLPNQQAIYNYPTLCFFEGTNISVGRGTPYPFQVYGAPGLKNAYFEFIPQSLPGAKNPPHAGEKCKGIDLRGTEEGRFNELQVNWWLSAYENYQQSTPFFNTFFVKLAGTIELANQIQTGKTAVQIRATWQQGLSDFQVLRSKYALYPL